MHSLREELAKETQLSIKIRVGYDKPENYLQIASIAEEVGCSHITVHGRTRAQMYSGTADWSLIKEVKDSVRIPVIGNGDIFTAEFAKEKIDYSAVDGVMLARGIFGNPWLIREIREMLEYGEVKTKLRAEDKVAMAIHHLEKVREDNPGKDFIFDVRKHICWYLKGLSHSAEAKNSINHSTDYDEIIEELHRLKEKNKGE